MDDQIITVLISVLSSVSFVKILDSIISRRKLRLEIEKQTAEIAKQKLDTTSTLQDVYDRFVADTKQRLDELCREVSEVKAANAEQSKIIANQQKQLDIQARRLSEQDKIIAAQGVKIAEQDEQIARLTTENKQLKNKK